MRRSGASRAGNRNPDAKPHPCCSAPHQTLGDVTFYAAAGTDENEVVLAMVLAAFYESVSLLLRCEREKKRRGNGARAGRRPSRAPTPHPSPSPSGSVEKKTVLENLDLALLAIDEIVDRGLILETDAATVAARASMAGAEGELPLAEQTLSKVMASAKEQLARSLLK